MFKIFNNTFDTFVLSWYNKNMGLFSLFKNLFKKKITIGNMDSKCLVTLKKSGKKIKFGSTLQVPDGFIAALVYKNRIADTFNEGNHRLDTNNMPMLNRMQKLSKPNKKGDLKKSFKADIYYINLKLFDDGSFESFDGFVLRDKVYKNVICKLSGQYSYQVFSPVDFMEGMFMRYGILRDGVAKNEISNWVSEISTRYAQKQKPRVEQLYAKDLTIFENLQDKLNKELSDVGLKITNLEITDIKLPKKVYKKVSIPQDKMQEPEKEIYVGEQYDLENPVRDAQNKNFENRSNEVYLETASNFEGDMNSKTLVVDSSGNSSIETGLNSDMYYNNYEANTSVNVETSSNIYRSDDFNKIDEQQKITEQEQQINDFEEMKYANQKIEPEVIQKTIEYKKCSNCGAYNSNSAETCFSCGHKFK